MDFNRGKVQILYNYLPGAVFAHDDYGHCVVTTVELNELPDINRSAVAEAITDTVEQWAQDWQRSAFPTARTAADLERAFVIGEPRSVQFEPFPTTLRCQRCGRVHRLADLRRSHSQPGRCPVRGCGAQLEQMPFVQAHHCGRLEEIFVQRSGCSRHGLDGLYFDDTGRVTTARWRCRLCSGAEVARLRQTPCGCEFSRLGTQDPSEQRLRFLAVTDPAVFKPQIFPFINFSRDQMAKLDTAEARPWVLARVWGLLDRSVTAAMEEQPTEETDEIAELVRALAEAKPNHPKVLAWNRRQDRRQQSRAVAEEVYRLLPGTTADTIRVSRRLIEQVAVLDSADSLAVETIAQRVEAAGDVVHARRLRETATWANEQLGIADMRALEGFPIGLASIGFTRISTDPTRTILNPFPQVDQRTPVYAVVASTEAIYFQIDPRRVVTWLQDNRLIPRVGVDSIPAAWSMLYREVPGLSARRNSPAYSTPAASAVRTLLHSMSHVLLRYIEWSGYAAQSVGEYLMPEGLASVLYASRYTDTKVGGLLTLFEQGLDRWLERARQEGGDCVMDPFCSEEGGACVGCLHREFNCTEFNRELSRATLFGGMVPQHGPAVVPFGPNTTGFWL